MTQFKFKVGQRVRMRPIWVKNFFGTDEGEVLSTGSIVTGRPYVVALGGLSPCFPEEDLELIDDPKPD